MMKWQQRRDARIRAALNREARPPSPHKRFPAVTVYASVREATVRVVTTTICSMMVRS